MFVHRILTAHRVPGPMPSAVLGSGNTKTEERQPPPEVALSEWGAQTCARWGPLQAGGEGGAQGETCSLGRVADDLGEVPPELLERMSGTRATIVREKGTQNGAQRGRCTGVGSGVPGRMGSHVCQCSC